MFTSLAKELVYGLFLSLAIFVLSFGLAALFDFMQSLSDNQATAMEVNEERQPEHNNEFPDILFGWMQNPPGEEIEFEELGNIFSSVSVSFFFL
jgi:hypothetical protein